MKKHVIVGTGIRGIYDYALPMETELKDVTRLVGVYDINYKRAALVSEVIGRPVPVYRDFDEMILTEKPDTVIVTTKDCAHSDYIIRAMELGCDVVCEKPLTTDEEKLARIVETKKRTGKDLKLTFNLRFQPFYVQIKQLLQSGLVGKIYNVHYEWKLSATHGSSYFRRWHRERRNSGSLLIHKSTHHFDLINWFIDQNPVSVNAYGSLNHFGPQHEKRSVRCLGCPYAKECRYFWDITKDPVCTKLYLECEDVDGYLRDKCVFSEEIDIEDSVAINVQYDGGAVMSYSLTGTSPYGGFRMYITGEKGRLEIHDEKRAGEENITCQFFDRNNNRMSIDFPIKEAQHEGHMGADPRLRSMVFEGYTSDPYNQVAGVFEGAMSIGIGIAANRSMKENRAVSFEEIYRGIELEK